jgi:Nitroreductase
MNETLKTIKSRRSTRNFNSDEIEEDKLQAIIEAAQYAPSAKNEQPWHFTIIKNKTLMNLLNESCKAVLLKSQNQVFQKRLKGTDISKLDLFYNAPVIIIISGNHEATEPQIGCTLAVENMFLAAESMLIGSCWIQAIKLLFETEEGKELLLDKKIILSGYEVICTAAFGYKANGVKDPLPRKAGVITYLL